MNAQGLDNSFSTEQDARDYASKASVFRNNNLYVILTGDTYFVSVSNKLQPYETILACFLKGQLVSPLVQGHRIFK